MNDQLPLTDDQLRLATSRAVPPCAALDTDTAAARASFLAFGAALESAASDFDEAALVSRLSREQTTTLCAGLPTPHAHVVRGSSDPASERAWPLLLSAALAASALFAIVRIVPMLPAPSPQIAVVAHPNRETRIQQSSPALAWNDPLDDEIAFAAATIEQYRSRGTSFDNSLFDMNIQLEALSQELLRESL